MMRSDDDLHVDAVEVEILEFQMTAVPASRQRPRPSQIYVNGAAARISWPWTMMLHQRFARVTALYSSRRLCSTSPPT